jgi:hypothetical protein
MRFFKYFSWRSRIMVTDKIKGSSSSRRTVTEMNRIFAASRSTLYVTQGQFGVVDSGSLRRS